MKNSIYPQPAAGDRTFSLTDLIADDCAEGRRGLLCPDSEIRPRVISNQTLTEKALVILFLDIRNFTGFLQSGPQSETVQTVKALLDLFTRIIVNFGGRIVDRAGDGLYAVYGLERLLFPAANNAIDSAKMLFESLEHVNQGFTIAKFGFPLEVGIGLHAGNVIIEYAHNAEMPLSVMGLPVNIAARLQAQTKQANNDLILSDEFYGLLTDDHKGNLNREKKQISVAGVQALQTIWLAGKPYLNNHSHHSLDLEMEYILAIAG